MATTPMEPNDNWNCVASYSNTSHIGRSIWICIDRTKWDQLCLYASRLNQNRPCWVLPGVRNGMHNLVRVLEFENKTRWVARVQLTGSTEESSRRLQSEVDTMTLIHEQTNIPLPRVFGYEINDSNPTGSAFILMECLNGSVATDVCGGIKAHQVQIPLERCQSFYSTIAQIQVQMTSLRYPKIGMVFKTPSGCYEIGPLPELGGPFETATEFIAAWAAHARFPKSERTLQTIPCPSLRAEILQSIEEFPGKILAAASRVVVHDTGPFPIAHRDFFHSNIIVDQNFGVQGVIDWEGACTLPWELVELPTFLETVPQRFDAPQNYNEAGQPNNEDTRRRWRERKEYIDLVAQMESIERQDGRLSSTLGNESLQMLAYAMRVYTDPGKLGFYNKILE